MAWPQSILDVDVQLLLGGSWTSLPSKVYSRDSIRIARTRPEGSTRPAPAQASLTFNARDGRFNPNNPSGIYYGQIGKNTPIRISAGIGGVPAYSAVSTGSWAIGTTSLAVTKPAGLAQGNLLLAWAVEDFGALGGPDLQLSGGTQWKPLDVSFFDTGISKCWYKIAGSAEPASYTLSNPGVGNGLVAIASFTGTLGFSDMQSVVTVTGGTTATTPSATPLGNNDIEVRFVAAIANVTYTPPATYTERVDFKAGTAISATVATKTLSSSAATGTQDFVSSGATTSVLGITITLSSRSIRFTGEVTGWPHVWTNGSKDIWTSINAAGQSQRLGAPGQQVPDSPMTVSLRTDVANGVPVLAAWPMEDGSEATSFGGMIQGNAPIMFSGSVSLAADNTVPGAKSLPTMSNTGRIDWTVPSYTNTGQWHLQFVTRMPAAPATTVEMMRWNVGNQSWTLSMTTGGVLTMKAFNESGTELLGDAGTNISESFGFAIAVDAYALQNGTGFDWSWIVTPLDPNYTGTAIWQTAGNRASSTLRKILGGFLSVGTHFASATLIGAISVNASAFPTFDLAAAEAFIRETAVQRLIRLCDTASVDFDFTSASILSQSMGVQRLARLIDLIQDAAEADGGLLYEPRHRLGYWYAPSGALYNRAPTLDLTYTANGEVGFPLKPADDDLFLVNDSTIERADGGIRRSTVDTGPLSTLEPPLGAGRAPESQKLYLLIDDQAEQMAGWRTHMGTYLDPGGMTQVRYPVIALSLANMGRNGLTGTIAQAADLDISDRITIDSVPATQTSPNDISNLVAGLTEQISQYTWDISVNGRPEGPWRVGVLGDTILGMADSQNSYLLHALTAGATSARIANDGVQATATMWSTTATPYDLIIKGERVTATAMTTNAISFVGVGVASHADNASLTPAFPAGIQLGDLLVLVAAIRNTAAFVNSITNPGGYTLMYNAADHFRIYGKIYDGSELAPTVGFVGGAAGDTTSAFFFALRNAQLRTIASALSTNGSAQNVAYPALTPQPSNGEAMRDGCAIIALAWKQDDYTSVATLSGFTEAIEASTVTGNDQSLTMDYVIQATATETAAGSFVVTGGAAAISKGLVLAIDGSVQTATLTRAVNGVSKAQGLGERVRLFYPATFAR